MEATPKQTAQDLFSRFEQVAYDTLTETGDGVEVRELAKKSAIITATLMLSNWGAKYCKAVIKELEKL
jgi:hypothetical protein